MYQQSQFAQEILSNKIHPSWPWIMKLRTTLNFWSSYIYIPIAWVLGLLRWNTSVDIAGHWNEGFFFDSQVL